MKYKYNLLLGLLASLIFASCEKIPTREFFPHSTPVIESASISPSTFTYGDSVTITAKVSDAETPLSTLEMKMIVNDMIIATQSLRTKGNSGEVSSKFKVPFIPELPDNARVEIQLSLINVEGDVTEGSINGVTGKRSYPSKLYAVLEDGTIIPLISQGAKSDKYTSAAIKIKGNNIRYKIVEAITPSNQIDYAGIAWGLENNTIKVIGERGGYITTTNAKLRYIDKIEFDSYLFETKLNGAEIDPNNLVLNLDDFSDAKIGSEVFKKITLPVKKDQTLVLEGDLAGANIVFNMDYFERVDSDLVKFIGDEGTYDLYYSEVSKFVIVNLANRSYPNVLLVCGEGLGYPSKVNPSAHTAWGFDNVLTYILFRKIATDVYQGTVYLDTAKANFKPFENDGWGNEKRSTDYTMPALIAKDTDLGKDDGNWRAATASVSGNYKITINLATKVVTATAVTLP